MFDVWEELGDISRYESRGERWEESLRYFHRVSSVSPERENAISQMASSFPLGLSRWVELFGRVSRHWYLVS